MGFLAALEYRSVNFVVAMLIWAMVYPMMVLVAFASLARVHERPKGMIITLAVNWLIKPFAMALIAVPLLIQSYGMFALAWRPSSGGCPIRWPRPAR
jgi:ACR3 family arsenite efflux pump ArsB